MRLLRLYTGEHRVLRNIEIPFDPVQPQQADDRQYHLDFLVGVNGTGKSTVLRLLGQIFRGVQASTTLETPFELEYWLSSQSRKIRVTNINPIDKTLLDRYFVTSASTLAGEYETDTPDERHLTDNIPAELLPARVIAYTTGSEEEWLNDTAHETMDSGSLDAIEDMSAADRALNELPGWVGRGRRPEGGEEGIFRLITKEHLKLVALSGFLLHRTFTAGNSPLQGVLAETGFKDLAGFSLEFDLSYASEVERTNIQERLQGYCVRAIRNGGRFLLVFDLSDEELTAQLLQANGGALPFFEMLADWHSGDTRILTRVNLFLARASGNTTEYLEVVPPLHTWDWLSDGEQSFLGRMCLFLLFGEVESLILLDEPEVHFNDFWKRHIVRIMHQVFEGKKGPTVSHVLVATHSSISLSDVHRDDILILRRNDLVTSTTKMPQMQTFGADPGEIMVHVFGTLHAAGQYSVNEIEEWLSTAFKTDVGKRRDYLGERLKEVAPGYWAYRIRREMVGLPLQ